MDNKRNLAFDRTNFIMLGIGFAVVVIGFILMSGGQSTDAKFDASVYSTMRIKVAPVICFLGFISMIFSIMRKPKGDGANMPEETRTEVTEQQEVTE